MSVYSDVTTLLSSGPYVDGKDWITSVEGKSKFKTLVDFDLDPKSMLSNFYDDTFKVGTQNTFEDIPVVFEAVVNKVISEMNDYVEIAQKAKKAIEEAIAKDAKAKQLAEEAYKNEPDIYTIKIKTVNGKTTKACVLDTEATKAAKEKAYAETWEENC